MKKLMFAFSFIFGGLIAVYAQDTTQTDRQDQQQYPTMQDDQDRERINSRDLPDAVKRSLEGTEFRGWLVNAAYKTTGTHGADSTNMQGNQGDTTSVSGDPATSYAHEVYVIELKNGAQTKTVRFDKDGQKLDDEGMKQDDQN